MLPQINAVRGLLVRLQTDVVGESLFTKITLIWFLTGMSPHMNSHVGVLCEPTSTVAAGEGFLLSVYDLVAIQVELLLEFLVALVAGEHLLPAVSSHVVLV